MALSINPTTHSNIVGNSPHTFNDMSIGEQSSDRVVLVGVISIASSDTNFTSVTIGGVEAFKLAEYIYSAGGRRVAYFAQAVPLGTSATIVVTRTNGQACAIGVFRILGTDGSLGTFSSAGWHTLDNLERGYTSAFPYLADTGIVVMAAGQNRYAVGYAVNATGTGSTTANGVEQEIGGFFLWNYDLVCDHGNFDEVFDNNWNGTVSGDFNIGFAIVVKASRAAGNMMLVF